MKANKTESKEQSRASSLYTCPGHCTDTCECKCVLMVFMCVSFMPVHIYL